MDEAVAAPKWHGLGFELAGAHLVLPLTQVSELVACNQVTPVPLTKSWVKGITNVRGRLLTVVDLSAFLGKSPLQINQVNRVIVINAESFQSALLVSKVFGLKHFDEDQARQDASVLDASVQPYVDYAFADNDILWGVFNVDRLVHDENFNNVGLDHS